VYINQGAVTDVVLDIRKNSKTYGQHFSIEITEQNPVAIYIPVGCAHGYLSKQNNTIVSYLQTSVYNNQCDKGIKWNSFGMNWNSNNQIITERDLSFLPFDKFKGTFL
jgi:dTDP-4-dehydrorhamnose 3,5-epimerase/CDP-3, 6-dideoxy-D-glycero-D-glycero-4-hexulose-5-epimerase